MKIKIQKIRFIKIKWQKHVLIGFQFKIILRNQTILWILTIKTLRLKTKFSRIHGRIKFTFLKIKNQLNKKIL